MIDRGDATVGGAVVVVGAVAVGTATQVHSSLVGPILTFVGVILVALLTAWFTKQRQRADLAAERDRQEKALDAENERQRQTISADFGRLDKQLAHDRQLHDLGELRAVVDDALRDAEKARGLWLDLHRVTVRPSYDKPVADQVYSALQGARRDVAHSAIRLTVRDQRAVASALWAFEGALSTPTLNPELADRSFVRDEWDKEQARLSDSHALFINIASTVVASDLPPTAPTAP